ncbi:hypothetical protein DV736_g934, partial [Chaetothyriales sp. CBS 134916]
MAYPPSSYGNRGPSRGLSRSFTVPHRQLSVHERAGLDQSDAEAGILYTHPSVRIFSFDPPPESINSKSNETHSDADYPIDTIETLPWRSRTEILVASGPLFIEKVRGSVPCFKCGVDFVQPIVRNSQCWCVDGESKFVLRRGKLQYYRYELPTFSPEEQKKVEELKTVLGNVLKYEITPCPFKRAFHVELPDDAIIPRRKGKWKRREASLPLTLDSPIRPLRRSEPGRSWRVSSRDALPTAEMAAARRGSDYGYVQTPRHASLRTSYLADRPETPSSMASSEEWEQRRVEEDSDDMSSEADEQEEHLATLDDVPNPVLVAKESAEIHESAATRVEGDFKISEAELPPIASQPTPSATANDDITPEDQPPLEQADMHDRGYGPVPVEEEHASEEEDQGVVMDDIDNDDDLLNIADIPEGTFLPSTPELHYLEEHADLLEEHGFSDEELEPLALAARHPAGTVDNHMSDPVSSSSAMNDRDSESVVSTSASFQTADSEGVASDGEQGNLLGMDIMSIAERDERLGSHSRHHKRDMSEITVTASNLSGSLEPRSASGLGIQSSAPTEEWPEPASSSEIQAGIRRRVKSRRALSPPPPLPNSLGASNQNHGSDLTSAIVQKLCRLAVVKPIEVLVLVIHVVVRIAGGATVNDLISGELFKLPPRGRRSTSFPDQVSRPQHEEEDEFGDNDDYGVPIRGRTRGARQQSVEGKQRPARQSEVELSDGGSASDDDEAGTVPQQRIITLSKSSVPQPKSILKKPRSRVSPSLLPSPSPSDMSDRSPPESRASSPGLVLDANSRAFKDRQAEDDAEILALEKKLGLKKGKTPKLFVEDGFGGLLDELDAEVEGNKRRREDKEWRERKRRKAEAQQHYMDSDGESNDFGGFGSGPEDDDGDGGLRQQSRVRENPYAPPVSANATGKYVPPSLRKAQSTDGQNHDRLHRQVQGHLNKLSEANLVSILNEVEKVYQSNPRHEVTSVLIDLLLSLFSDRSTLQNTFVILHAAFITAIYRVVGTDFGAELLSRLVERFTEYHAAAQGGKAGLNLMSLLANLVTFNMISSAIVYDYIYLFLPVLTEANTELLLRIIRDCGLQLRADDPAALKAAVSQTQSNARALEASGQAVSVRTKFLIETIVDLKNNKMREATADSGVTKEHITRMRKVLGSLNSRPLRVTEPLRISLSDLQNSEKKGKWWLVGASWKGHSSADSAKPHHNQGNPQSVDNDAFAVTARDYGLITPLQQLIFAAISGADTYVEAHVRVTKLRLKRSQEPEIARVILRLCGSEQQYNPFYAHLAKQLCGIDGGKRMKKTFDFALWTFFRRLGENANNNNEDEQATDEDVAVEEINNIAHFYADLIHWCVVDLAVLKVLDLQYLKELGLLFVEMMLVRLLVLCKDDQEVQAIFERAAAATRVAPRLKLFLKDHVKKSDLAGGTDKTNLLRQRCRIASRSLASLSVAGSDA